MKRSTPLRRTKPIRKRNAVRWAKRHAVAFGPQSFECRERPCSVVGSDCWGPIAAHHEPPRSCGGEDKDTVGLCRGHHRERHSIGERAFNEKYDTNLRQLAAALHEQITRSKQDADT